MNPQYSGEQVALAISCVIESRGNLALAGRLCKERYAFTPTIPTLSVWARSNDDAFKSIQSFRKRDMADIAFKGFVTFAEYATSHMEKMSPKDAAVGAAIMKDAYLDIVDGRRGSVNVNAGDGPLQVNFNL